VEVSNEIISCMKRRCLDKNNQRYKDYGARGVKISDDWLSFNNFLRDVDSIEGFDIEKLMNSQISLDKDIKNSKIYSKETCMFVSPEVNNMFKPNQMKKVCWYFAR
jgi:hypothetical protein